jgi:hypothetical protein
MLPQAFNPAILHTHSFNAVRQLLHGAQKRLDQSQKGFAVRAKPSLVKGPVIVRL